jgi:hypothetical protein
VGSASVMEHFGTNAIYSLFASTLYPPSFRARRAPFELHPTLRPASDNFWAEYVIFCWFFLSPRFISGKSLYDFCRLLFSPLILYKLNN